VTFIILRAFEIVLLTQFSSEIFNARFRGLSSHDSAIISCP